MVKGRNPIMNRKDGITMKHPIPCAYAVAVWTGRRYIYFGGYIGGKQAITLYKCCAKLYARRESANATADFLGSDGFHWEVVPMYEKD